jgi:serine protease Do
MRITAVLLLLTTMGVRGQAPSRANALRQMSQQFESLVQRVDPAVVQIITTGFAPQEQDGDPMLKVSRGSGSGVVVDAEGYILTNAHVIRNARSVQVLLPEPAEEAAQYRSVVKPAGKKVTARVVGQDRQTDLALLKIEARNLPHLVFEDSEKLRQGQLVLAFGSPFGLENSVTMGIISSVARQIRPDDPMIYLQTDAAINPGNSGGPLVDPEGKLVGINTFILSSSGANAGVGFAVPSNIAKSVFQQIREHGYVKRGQIGVIAQTITPDLAKALGLAKEWGVIIADVAPKSSAEAAGLEVKDIVLTFNGKVMENARQMGVNIYSNSGQTAVLEVLRGTETMIKKVAVLERPQDPDRILSLVEGEKNHIPRLGVLAVDLTEKVTALMPPLRRLSGAVIAGVVADLTIEDQFLLPGDVVFGVNGGRVSNLAELKAAVAGLPVGQPVALQVERMGQFQFVVVELN